MCGLDLLLEEFFYGDESMSVSEMSFVKTGDARSFTPEPGMKRQVLAHSDQLMLVRHYFEKGWVGARHSHPHHQLVYVVSGAIRVDVDGRTFDVLAGDSFVVDGGVGGAGCVYAGARRLSRVGEIEGVEDKRPGFSDALLTNELVGRLKE